MNDRRLKILSEITQERERQDAKHGTQEGLAHSDYYVFTAEEWAEATKEFNDMWFGRARTIEARGRMRTELIQTCACIVKWLEVGPW